MDPACALLQFAGHMGLDRHLFSLLLGTVDLGEYLDRVPVEDCRSEMVDFPELVVRVEQEDWQDGQGKLLSQGTPALGNFVD
ncbi:hypothetical protein MHYP_G00092770 [Metynnis hypsauchen]